MQNQRGQTLIEVMIALTIGVLVIGALAIATVVSIRNATFSQNQTQAAKYAQEGIELVRTTRDRNAPVSGTVSQRQLQTFQDLWNVNFGPAKVNNQTIVGFTGYFKLDPVHLTLTLVSNTPSDQEQLNNFKRQVIIEDGVNPAQEKTVTVLVSWQDTSGFHTSNLQTILTKQ